MKPELLEELKFEKIPLFFCANVEVCVLARAAFEKVFLRGGGRGRNAPKSIEPVERWRNVDARFFCVLSKDVANCFFERRLGHGGRSVGVNV